MSALPPEIENHVDIALGRLFSQFDDAANLRDVIRIFAERIQVEESLAYDVLVDRLLANASGAQLDQYGTIVSESRDGLTDDEYRRVINAKILTGKRLSWTRNNLLEIINLVTGAEIVRIIESFPAGIGVSIVVNPELSEDSKLRTVRLIRQAKGEGIQLEYVGLAGVSYFGFLEDPNALGFGSGAPFAEMIA